ncbi:MAG: cation transporter, partial [Leptolyngbyaceae bacterium]|nr:cation transporter [Leptolyngbyaceae bacterium]
MQIRSMDNVEQHTPSVQQEASSSQQLDCVDYSQLDHSQQSEQSEQSRTSSQESSNQESSNVINLTVDGMKCAGCVSAVEKKLMGHPSVADASVNLVTARATVVLADLPTDSHAVAEELSALVTDSGFPTTVDGSSFAFGEANQETSDQHTNGLGQDVADRGADGKEEDVEDDAPSKLGWASRFILHEEKRSLAIALVLLIVSFIGHLKHFGWGTIPILSNIWFHFGLATLALLWPGRSILVDGWRSLRHGIPNMNTLVGMGMTTSYGASVVALLVPALGWECFFDEPVMLVGFILLGRTLEQGARTRAKKAIEALFSQQPQVARLLPRQQADVSESELSEASFTENNGSTQQQCTEIPTRMVQVGQWLKVLPGDQMPVDGTIISGQTTVNEAILTGESLPVEKSAGDRVSAGSLNQSGAVVIQATRVGRETTLSKMIQLVETAQTRKAPVQKL